VPHADALPSDSAPSPGPPDPARVTRWFEEEVVRLLPDLLDGARSLASSEADAEDLVAQTVAQAWSHLGDLRERTRFRGWLFCILRNVFLSGRRREDARPEEVPLPGEGEEEPSFSLFERLHQPFLLWSDNPEQRFLDELLGEELEEAMASLPEASAIPNLHPDPDP